MPRKDPKSRAQYSRDYQREWIKRPEVRIRRKRSHDIWAENHPEVIAIYAAKSAPKKRERIKQRRRERRASVIALLGGKCTSVECRWLNEDGTLGCSDPRLLQVDHKNGGGTQERKRLSYDVMLRRIASGKTDGYQLLCASCNWLKAHTQNEFASMEGKRK